MLLDQLSELDKPHPALIDRTIEDLSAEREPDEPAPPLVGAKRVALDYAFRHNSVEEIIGDLGSFTMAEDPSVKQWASETLATLHTRSPTSLKVALEAIRRGKRTTLVQVLNMELKIATAFCVGELIVGIVISFLHVY
jgi:3-hydroxyisobutyryl-CoA hydrolase